MRVLPIILMFVMLLVPQISVAQESTSSQRNKSEAAYKARVEEMKKDLEQLFTDVNALRSKIDALSSGS